MSTAEHRSARLTGVQWLVCGVAALGFAFDTYELLMMPLVARPGLTELLTEKNPAFDPLTPEGNGQILYWTGWITYASAVCGGVFGLLGGMLTDRFGRKRVLFWSIMLYALSPFAAAFSTSPQMLLVLRCTTFIGVCVEFVAAVAWIAELFPEPKRREAALGYTQAFASVGGLLVSGIYLLIVHFSTSLPAIYEKHSEWRYLLISGLIPAIPMILLLPFLPESPAWLEKKAKGTLRRPSLGELFQPALRRTTIVTTIMFACSLGAAFGAIQLAPQIVPGLVPELKDMRTLSTKYNELSKKQAELAADSTEAAANKQAMLDVKKELGPLVKQRETVVGSVQMHQEIGGLIGRCVLAVLAMWIVSRRWLLRIFQWPGLFAVPIVFAVFAGYLQNLELFKWGMFAAGFFTVAQLSFWGNYLPRVYPTHLRGTGEGFAANVGGRMLGTSAQLAATQLAPLMAVGSPFTQTAYAAAIVGGAVYLIGSLASFWLPEPQQEELPE